MSNALSTPLRENERIKLIDSIRGLALLGILLMNIMAQSQSAVFYSRMDPRQAMTGLNFYAWAGEMMFFEGTMRGLFSILFGAGTILLLTRLIKSKSGLEPADIFYRRLLWLLVFGLVNAFVFYGLAIFFTPMHCAAYFFSLFAISRQKIFCGLHLRYWPSASTGRIVTFTTTRMSSQKEKLLQPCKQKSRP